MLGYTMMCAPIAESDFPMWVLVFERIGPGSAILVFCGAVLWKLIPSLSRLLTAWKKQSEKVTEAVPQVMEGLRELVSHAERIADHVTSTPSNKGNGGGVGLRMHRHAADTPGTALDDGS